MAKDNNTLLIVGGIAVVGLVVYAVMNKGNQATGSTVNNNAATPNYAANSAQNISAFGNAFSGLGTGFASVWGAISTSNANKPAAAPASTSNMT